VKELALPPGERRLAWAVTEQGDPVVATDGALLLPGADRLPWEQVERVGWQRPRMTVLEVAELEGSGTRHVLELADAGDLPEIVWSRVTASVAWSTHSRLAPAGGVRVVGRRVEGEETLRWQLVYDRGTQLQDPLVRAQAEQLLDGARRTIG